MAKVLQKFRIDKLSLVDRGAGEGCAVVQPKRDADAPPTARAREAALQSAADAYTAETLAKSNRGPRTGEYDQYAPGSSRSRALPNRRRPRSTRPSRA